ncbi:MAG: hypothetical protein WB807_11050 [Candidatus Dormiibacterota bacterium]
MPAVVIAKSDDEIADLIDRVRSSPDLDVGLVVPGSSRALQTPLNVRLLAQFSSQSGRRTSIVTEDPRVQQLARVSGLQVYGSVPAFERGIELAGPRGGGASVGRGIASGAGGLAAAAVLEPPPAPPPVPPSLTPPAHAPTTARLEPRRVLTQLPPARPARGWDRRRFFYVAGAVVAILGIVLFMALAPSAKVTITIAATPLSVSPTIQGTTSPAVASQADHVLTGVVTSNPSQSFQATPTGTTTLPAVAAKVVLTFTTNSPSDISFALNPNNPNAAIQTSDQSVTFVPAAKTIVCIGPTNPPPSGSSCQNHPFNASASYVAQTAGVAGNVAANTLTVWNGNPCPSSPNCLGSTISVTNNNPASGGTDPRQVTAASATDVANWTAQVTQIESALAAQVQTDLLAKAAGKTIAKDPTGNGEAIAYSGAKPALPAANTPFTATTITVAAAAQASIYDAAAVRNDVIADLDKLVKPGDELAPGRLNTPPCAVTQANDAGTVVLACSATDFSQPMVNLNTLKAHLTGRNPGNAQAIVESNIAKVQGVTVTEWPFKLFYLPLRASQIAIDENFVVISTKSP